MAAAAVAVAAAAAAVEAAVKECLNSPPRAGEECPCQGVEVEGAIREDCAGEAKEQQQQEAG